MIRYLVSSLRRQLIRSRTLFLLAVVGVALGVASVVAIQTLNRGALDAFDGSMRAVSGQADLSVLGAAPAFSESLLVTVMADPDVAGAWPLCRVDASVRDEPGLLLDVVGVDVFAPVRYPVLRDGGTTSLAEVAAAVVQPGWVALTPDLAARHGWSVGDTLVVGSGSRSAALVIGALVDFRRVEPLAPANLALMDIGWAQSLLARRGLVHQIDIRLAEGADAALAAGRLASALGPSVSVRTPEQRRQDAAGLLAAFRLNLTALSLISVFVGVFLVLTSVRASLARRRRELGLLRCLGAGRRSLMLLIVTETAVLAVPGVVVGVPLGYAVARWNLDTVSGTLTNIYVLEAMETVVFDPVVALVGLATGLIGAVLGAALPAWDMLRRDPLRLLAPLAVDGGGDRTAGRLAAAAGALLGGVGVWFVAAGSGTPAGGFVFAAGAMLALPLLVPLVVRIAGRAARPGSLGLGLGLRNLTARLQTSSFAVAALGVTVSMLVGVTLLVGSFRQTLVEWLDVTIRADVYVSTESWVRAGAEALLEPELLAAWRSRPAVAAVEEQRRLSVKMRDGDRRIWLNGLRLGDSPHVSLAERLPLVAGDPEAAARRFAAGEALIGEPLARKEHLAAGDTLHVVGGRGTVALPVAGVVRDYTSEGGTAMVDLDVLQTRFGAGAANNAALFLIDGADVDREVAALQQRYADRPLVFRSNRTLRGDVLAVFDQTFAVTGTLRSLALLTALCGISLTLLVQARERAGELALLRALGTTRRQVFALFLGEGAAIGVLGSALGFVGGCGLAALLIFVVNRQWFGWTIEPAWQGQALVLQGVAVLAATVASAAVPGLRAGLSGAADLARDDQ